MRTNKSPKQQRKKQERSGPKTVAPRQANVPLARANDDSSVKAKLNVNNMGAGERVKIVLARGGVG
jgi:hypothetical protein